MNTQQPPYHRKQTVVDRQQIRFLSETKSRSNVEQASKQLAFYQARQATNERNEAKQRQTPRNNFCLAPLGPVGFAKKSANSFSA